MTIRAISSRTTSTLPIRYALGVSSSGAIVEDFDQDGRPDLLVTSFGDGFAMLRNRGCQ